MNGAANQPGLDITSAAFTSNPFPSYVRLREEAPVIQVNAPRFGPAYLLTRYRDVEAALKDERLVKDRSRAPAANGARPRNLPRILAPLERGLLSLDGPDHDRLRSLVRQAFTPRRVEVLAQQAERRIDGLLTKAQRRGSVDLIADVALPFSLGCLRS